LTVQEVIDELSKVTDKSLPVHIRLKTEGFEQFYCAFPASLLYLSSTPRLSTMPEGIFGIYIEATLIKRSISQTRTNPEDNLNIAPGGAEYMGKKS
jgi:hypothetical protein